MTPAEAAAALDAIPAGDPDGDHSDRILLAVVPVEVSEAYARLVDRSDWWATA